MKSIFAFYQSIPGVRQEVEMSISNVWKATWTKHGWNPLMLNRSHASSCTHYHRVMAKLLRSPIGGSPLISHARIVRWCALYGAGGGWMSDYDLINLGVTPEHADHFEALGSLHINDDGPARLFFATRTMADSVIRRFLNEELVANGILLPEAEILGHKSLIAPLLALTFHPSHRGTPKLTQVENVLNPPGLDEK